MQVVITIAGLGQRFQQQGYIDPKPLVPVIDKPAIYYLIESFSKTWKLFFVIGEHLKNTEVEAVIKSYRPGAVVIYTANSDRGPIDTVLKAIPFLNGGEPVAVSYCDYAVVWNPAEFEKSVLSSQCDCAIVSYRGFHPTYLGPNTYAHLLVDELSNRVLKIQEKKLFGNDIQKEWSSVGLYYFRNVSLLEKGLQLQLKNNLKHGNEFYTSLAIQALLDESENSGSEINVLNYQISHIMQMGTPADIQLIEKWYSIYKKKEKVELPTFSAQDVLQFQYFKVLFENLFTHLN